MNPNTPIDTLEGVGPAITTQLNEHGVYSVFDVLRVPAEAMRGRTW